MLKRTRTWSFGYLVVAAALFVAACGSTVDSGETSIVDPNGGETSDGLPVNDTVMRVMIQGPLMRAWSVNLNVTTHRLSMLTSLIYR